MSAFEDVHDQQEAESIDLSANKAEDFVEYMRGSVVGHEEEGLLMWFGMLTGYTADDNCHVNVIGKGSPGSGKSLTKNTVEKILPSQDTYVKTDASDNALLDSVDWDIALCAPLDEYDKLSGAIREFLKSMNAEDGGYSKDRNVEDPDSPTGYSPTEVSSEAMPWTILYAPTSRKSSIDDELDDRACILYFTNTRTTRRGIGRKEWGHDEIQAGTEGDQYIYDNQALAVGLRQRTRDLDVERIYDDVDGEQRLVARSGDTYIYTPQWAWYAAEPIFNVDEDYTNRVYGIVHDLVAASALINQDNRNWTDIDVYPDEDSTDTVTREAVVVGPQDVANVLSCLPTLLSTTHQLTPLKRHILDAVDATEPQTDADGTTVTRVQEYLDKNDIPHPTRQTLKDRMDELAEEYYLQKWDSSAGPKGQADAYEQHDEGALQPPNIRSLQQYADEDAIQLASHPAVEIDPDDPFDGIDDPIRNQPFKETVSQFRAEFSGSTNEESVMDMALGGDGGNDSQSQGNSPTSSTETQSSLTDVDEDGVDADSGSMPELDPDGEPSDPTEQYVYEQCQSNQGSMFTDQHNVVHYMGICGTDESPSNVNFEGTPVDPDHELWQNRTDLTDDRVTRQQDARTELQEAFDSLRGKQLVMLDANGGPPAMSVLLTAE